jgi:hypothetical protein
VITQPQPLNIEAASSAHNLKGREELQTAETSTAIALVGMHSSPTAPQRRLTDATEEPQQVDLEVGAASAGLALAGPSSVAVDLSTALAAPEVTPQLNLKKGKRKAGTANVKPSTKVFAERAHKVRHAAEAAVNHMQTLKALLDHCKPMCQKDADDKDLKHYARLNFPLRYGALSKRVERATNDAKAETSKVEELMGQLSAKQHRIDQLEGEVVEASRRLLTAERRKTEKLELAAKSAKEAREEAQQLQLSILVVAAQQETILAREEASRKEISLRKSLTAERKKLEGAAKSAKEALEQRVASMETSVAAAQRETIVAREDAQQLKVAVESLKQRLAAAHEATNTARDEAQLQQTMSR